MADYRRTGRTTEQMKAAPEGAIFVWVNDRLEYPKQLATIHGRADLMIVSPAWLRDGEAVRGLNRYVAVDHAAQISDRAHQMIFHVNSHRAHPGFST